MSSLDLFLEDGNMEEAASVARTPATCLEVQHYRGPVGRKPHLQSIEKFQVSVFLANDLSLDEWCAGVYVLPTVA